MGAASGPAAPSCGPTGRRPARSPSAERRTAAGGALRADHHAQAAGGGLRPDGEPYRPGCVDIVLDNPEVALRQVGNGDPVVMRAPERRPISSVSNQGFYLDFPGSSLSPGCIYETDFWKYSGDRPAAVYAHVVQQTRASPTWLYLQYWFYWYFNDWNNKHESDWEGVTLQFEAASVEEALAGQPIAVGYSQHEGGERAEWDDDKLDARGRPPGRVLVGRVARQLLRVGGVPRTGRQRGIRVRHDHRPVRSCRAGGRGAARRASTIPNDPLAWLAFNGRWGERQGGPFNGPTGPAPKARWLDPAPWFDGSPRRERRDPGWRVSGQVGRQRLLRRRRARVAGADQLQDVAWPGRAHAADRGAADRVPAAAHGVGRGRAAPGPAPAAGWARSSAPRWRRTSGNRSCSCASAWCTSRRRCSPG